MKKWMLPLTILLTAVLLIFLGFLPTLAGVLLDCGLKNEVSRYSVHSIAPYISKKDSGLRFTEKLTVMYESEISSIVPALASMTEQQVRLAVEEGIQPYMDAGIIQIHGTAEFHASPYIAISWQDTQQYFLFWSVSLTDTDSNSKYSLTLTLDDETGAILKINYYDQDRLPGDSHWDKSGMLPGRFAQIWLEQAGLQECARPLPTEGNGQQITGVCSDLQTVVYEITDGDKPPIYLYFHVANHGEYLMWLDNTPG